MANVPDILTIIKTADISEYLSSQKLAARNFYGEGPIDKRLSILLLMERTAVEWAYDMNPTDSTLVSTGEYLYALSAPYSIQAQVILSNITQSPPVITGPVDQSVTVGDNATFSVSVVSSLPVTYQWYLNGSPIVGANSQTYTKTDAQLSDSGGQYSVIVANSAGSATSNTATLTVTAVNQGRFYWGDTDYSADINAGDNDVPYNGVFPYTPGQPLQVQFPAAAANFKYIAVEYPVTESTKTQYASPPIDSGIIPSIAFDNVKTIGSVKIIFSRSGNPFSQNTSNPVTFS